MTGMRWRHQRFTWVSVALVLAGVALLATGAVVLAAACFLVAFLCVLPDFQKCTGRFQFIMLTVSALMVGVSADLHAALPLPMAVAMLFSAAALVVRQAWMPVLTHLGKPWLEPALLLAAAAMIGPDMASQPAFRAEVHAFPAVPFLSAFLLMAFYLQDGLLLRRRTRQGYRVQPGMPAPDFTLPDQQGRAVRLSDHFGKHPVLLLFIRGDWCPGCHVMLRTYEKHRGRFLSRNVHVLGIGPDNVETNRDMMARIGAGYQLLSDAAQGVSQRYGVVYDNAAIESVVDYAEGIPLPASFLVDAQGMVRYVSRPDRVGEFLDPTLIFGVLDRLPETPGQEELQWKAA